MTYSFLTSILSAGLLEVISQGASSISFNWWLRADNVNNYSVVIVSDVFIAAIFLIVALVLVVRLVKSWNIALMERVASIRVTSHSHDDHRSSSSFSSEKTPLLLQQQQQPESSAASAAASAAAADQNATHDHALFDFDALSLSFHEVRWMLRKLFVVDGTTMFWLLLAALTDTFHSLCETYSAGRITVLTQLFLKAAEPFLVWLLALRWRSEETTQKKRKTTTERSSSSSRGSAGRDDDTAIQHQTPSAHGAGASDATPRSTLRTSSSAAPAGKQQQHHHQDDEEHEGEIQRTVSIDVPFTERFCELCSCCCGCSVSNLRLILSLISLICVAAGIVLHFVVEIRKEEMDEKNNKTVKESPIGFVIMYCFSVVGSALYTIAFGRYIFLVRRVSVHASPLDMLDYIRAVEHQSLTEHQVSVVGGVSNRSFQFSNRGDETTTAAADNNNNDNESSQSEHLAPGSPAAVAVGAAASVASPTKKVLDLADDPRDMDVGYQRRSSLTSIDQHGDDGRGYRINHGDDDDGDDHDHDGAMAWGERLQHNGQDDCHGSPVHQQHHPHYSPSSSARPSPSLGPAASPSQQQFEDDTRHSIGPMSVVTSSTAAGAFQRNGNKSGNSNSPSPSSRAAMADEDENEALAILEENHSDIAPSNTDVRLIACALETFFALIFSVLVAPAFEFLPGDSSGISSSSTINGTKSTTYQSVDSFSELLNNTETGIDALGSASTMLPAGVTLVGWTFVYVADSILNHLNAPLSSLINQLGTPVTAIFLYIVPSMDASGDPVQRYSSTSVGVQIALATGSVLLLLVGSLLMYVAERSGPTRKIR